MELTNKIKIKEDSSVLIDGYNITHNNEGVFIDGEKQKILPLVEDFAQNNLSCAAMIQICAWIVLRNHYDFKGKPLSLIPFEKFIELSTQKNFTEEGLLVNTTALSNNHELYNNYVSAKVALSLQNFSVHLQNPTYAKVSEIEQEEMQYADKTEFNKEVQQHKATFILQTLNQYEHPEEVLKDIVGSENTDKANSFKEFLELCKEIEETGDVEDFIKDFTEKFNQEGCSDEKLKELSEALKRMFGTGDPQSSHNVAPQEFLLKHRPQAVPQDTVKILLFEAFILFVQHFAFEEYQEFKRVFFSEMPPILFDCKVMIFTIYQSFIEDNAAFRLFDAIHKTNPTNLRNSQIAEIKACDDLELKKFLQKKYNEYCELNNCSPLFSLCKLGQQRKLLDLGIDSKERAALMLDTVKELNAEDKRKLILMMFPSDNESLSDDEYVIWRGAATKFSAFIKSIYGGHNVEKWDEILKRFKWGKGESVQNFCKTTIKNNKTDYDDNNLLKIRDMSIEHVYKLYNQKHHL